MGVRGEEWAPPLWFLSVFAARHRGPRYLSLIVRPLCVPCFIRTRAQALVCPCVFGPGDFVVSDDVCSPGDVSSTALSAVGSLGIVRWILLSRRLTGSANAFLLACV